MRRCPSYTSFTRSSTEAKDAWQVSMIIFIRLEMYRSNLKIIGAIMKLTMASIQLFQTSTQVSATTCTLSRTKMMQDLLAFERATFASKMNFDVMLPVEFF